MGPSARGPADPCSQKVGSSLTVPSLRSLLHRSIHKARLWGSFLLSRNYLWAVPLLQPRVYDCFLFSNEEQLLELRLRELEGVVDQFVIVEGALTFTGIDRGGFRAPSVIERLPPALRAKVRFVPIQRWEYDSDTIADPWRVEWFMRNQLRRGLYDLRPWDFVWISDVDEIPNPARVHQLGRLGMLMSYYKLNLVDDHTLWDRAKAVIGLDLWLRSPEEIRHGACLCISLVPQGGWHFSYLMTAAEISGKLNSFSHQEFNTAVFNNEDYISDCIREGRDLFGRPEVSFHTLADLSTLPKTVQANPQDYLDLLIEIRTADASSTVPSSTDSA